MSVFRNAKSPYYQYDFQVGGDRFHGSTKATNKKDAERVEKEIRAKAKDDVALKKATGNLPLTIDVAAGRYWKEIGQRHAGSADTWNDLARLIKYFGKDKRLDQITDSDVAALVAWRSAQTKKGRKKSTAGKAVPLIAPATVNRSTTGVLRKLFTRARRTWRYQFPLEPIWGDHWLKEPVERVRELHDDEGLALDKAVREDYRPWLEFVRLTGLRLNETLLTWDQVNWSAATITRKGKGGKIVATPITEAVREVLEPLRGHHPKAVFTYRCIRGRKDRKRGQRYPITYGGAKSEWRRLRARSGVKDFRLHDIRHDVASKTLRATGNLKLVQQVMNHSDIKVTVKYAHVLDSEVAAALESVAKSRNLSRTAQSNSA